MYGHPNSRAWSLYASANIYNTPLLLANALEQLECLANKNNSGTTKSRRAGPGCVIDLLDLEDNSKSTIELVLPTEASPKNRRISVLSPLGSSLLNLKSGDVGHVDLWGVSHEFRVLDIRCTDKITAKKEEIPS